jgi:hypothetical protein
MFLLSGSVAMAGATSAPAMRLERSERVETIAKGAAGEALEKFKDAKLEESQLAVSVIDLREPDAPRLGSFRGGERIYPASVVKLFYLEAAHRWMEDGKLADSPELREKMREMIVNSSNTATGWVLDAITGTTSGEELPVEEMKVWAEKRNAINRHFASMGYENINVNQKTWEETPYGRDKQFLVGNRNALTTDATARLMAEIATGRAVTAERSKQMMALLKRQWATTRRGDDQATDFAARALVDGDRLWSKAGWTSTTRHDAIYVERADGTKAVIVVFTLNHAREREIVPTVVGAVLREMASDKPGAKQ